MECISWLMTNGPKLLCQTLQGQVGCDKLELALIVATEEDQAARLSMPVQQFCELLPASRLSAWTRRCFTKRRTLNSRRNSRLRVNMTPSYRALGGCIKKYKKNEILKPRLKWKKDTAPNLQDPPPPVPPPEETDTGNILCNKDYKNKQMAPSTY